MVKARFNPKAPVIVVTPTFVGKNGLKKMINVALDTGATYTMISWEIAENLGYEPALSKDKIDMVTASGVEKAPFITLKGVSLLGMKAQNVQILELN